MTTTPDNPTEKPVEPSQRPAPHPLRRVRTPTFLQMEAVECGAAALGIILRYYGKYIPLEELRLACGVSRDGSNAANILKAAQQYGLQAKGVRRSNITGLQQLQLPFVVYWNFNHFLVVEGFGKHIVYLNDPATGPRTVTLEEFDESFTGVALIFELGPDFRRSGEKFNLIKALRQRLVNSELGLMYVVLASLFLVIPGLIIPIFLRIFVDDILLGGHNWIGPLLVGMGVTVLMRAVLTWLQQTYLLRLETKLSLSTSSQFFWHVLRLPVEFFTQRYAGDIAFRVQLNDQVAQLLSGELATTLINLLLIIFYALLMVQYDPLLTLIGVSVAIANIGVLQYISRHRIDANRRLLHENGRLVGTAMNGLGTIETLKATGSESDFFARWAGLQAKAVNAEQQIGFWTQILNVVPPSLVAINTATILFIGGIRVLNGNLTIGMLVAFQSLMLSFTEPVIRLLNLGSRFQEAEGSMSRLDDVLRYPIDTYNMATETVEIEKSNKLEGYLEIKDVSFGYSRLEAPLIENFSLSLKPGDRVALVGTSGSGKSTISNLVAGLYAPWAGEILFDGKSRGAIPRSVLNASMAMVDQTIQLFSGTVRDNLTLWNPTIPKSRIIQAAKDACIHEQITAHPGSYDHWLEENGRNFSGGERQRLEIARALVNNPTLLVLDEATSALDPLTEQVIDDNLRQRGCACLIIAHRLSTIRDCDEIIVMEKGKIVQRGTHKDLVRQDGPYAELVGAEKPKEDKRNVKSLLDKLL